MRTFLILWFGQVVAFLGKGLTGFALGIWVYQQTGSVTQFALIAFFSSLPGLVISPIAGALVDRWERRFALLFSVGLGVLISLILAAILWNESSGLLRIWHIYVLMAVASVANAFQWPAFTAATTLLVPKHHLGRASGLAQMALAITQVGSPALGGVLLTTFGLREIVLADLAAGVFGLLTLFVLRFREPEREPEQTGARTSLWSDSAYGWRYLKERPGLLALLYVFAGSNFVVGMLQALLTPLIMSFASAREVGSVLSIGGLGMLAGTVLMSIWGGPNRRMLGVVAGLVVQSLVLLLGGVRPSLTLIASAAFVFLFVLPLINGCSQAIWQTKVPLAVQGRVFAVRRMVALSSMPLAYFVAGPLADRVFEPLLAPGGALAATVGALIGTGKGRGIGFLFLILGFLVLVWLAVSFTNPRLRNVEDELPDAVPDEDLSAPGKPASGLTLPGRASAPPG